MWEKRGKLSYGQGNGQARTRGAVQPLGSLGVETWGQVWAGGHRSARGLWSGLSPPPNFPGQTQTMRNSKREDATSISAGWTCRSCPPSPVASCTLLHLLHGSQTQPHHEPYVLRPQALVLCPPHPTTSSHSTFRSQLKSC